MYELVVGKWFVKLCFGIGLSDELIDEGFWYVEYLLVFYLWIDVCSDKVDWMVSCVFLWF